MSHPQFHSTNLFILRHAWLNLLDKHMTTGRINQVTIVRRRDRPTMLLRMEELVTVSPLKVGGSTGKARA